MDTSTPVVLLSLTSDLELTLRALLDRTLESVLPNDIQQRLLRHPKLCSNSDEGMGQVLEKEMVEMHRSAATSAEESPIAETELQNKPIGDETYIERSLLVDIAKWARHPKSSKSLRRSHLGMFSTYPVPYLPTEIHRFSQQTPTTIPSSHSVQVQRHTSPQLNAD